MSVRAYGIKIDYAKLSETFNIWHDEDIVDALMSVSNVFPNENRDIRYVYINEEVFKEMKQYFSEHDIKLTDDEEESMKRIWRNIRKGIYNYICF